MTKNNINYFGSTNNSTPAARLLGAKLAGGWTVIEKLERLPGATGGCFSEGYLVENGEKRGFLKALDFSAAFNSPDPARELQAMTTAYNFERDLLEHCKAKRLDRVVFSIGDGSICIDPTNPLGTVQYLIFDLADGDIRQHLDQANRIELAWKLRTLHYIAVGLTQLHGQGISHNDLKPSNVLVFKSQSKIADLGSATRRSVPSPNDDYDVVGDPVYAPPEELYGFHLSDWNRQRIGCDMYLLGSLILYIFTGMGANSLIALKRPAVQKSQIYSFANILPELQQGLSEVLIDFQRILPAGCGELAVMVAQLCEPDPAKRGHPKNRIGHQNPCSLERYVSRFEVLARKAEMKVLGAS